MAHKMGSRPKTAVFDSDEYAKLFDEKQKADNRLKRYEPLCNMSQRLFRAVVITLTAAILQLTLGLYPTNLAALACIMASAVSVWQITGAVVVLGKNMKAWFDSIDRHANTTSPPTHS